MSDQETRPSTRLEAAGVIVAISPTVSPIQLSSSAVEISTPDPTCNSSSSIPTTTLSKNQQKRQAKLEAKLAQRPAKRKEEKARRKAKKREYREALSSQHNGGKHDDEDEFSSVSVEPASKRKKMADDVEAASVFPARVVFDCSFDDQMTEKEVVSLDRQLAHSYSVNRRARTRFEHLLCTSFSGKLKTRLVSNSNQYQRWKNFTFKPESLSQLCAQSEQLAACPKMTDHRVMTLEKRTDPLSDTLIDESQGPQYQQTSWLSATSQDQLHMLPPTPMHIKREDIIYLTADSPNVLTELLPSKTYVIGGIVDRNRCKQLCLNLAIEQGFEHAQLPIGQYMAEMKTRKVLTVNQVLEILVTWLNERSWRNALEHVIPKRKMTEDCAA